MIRPVIRAAAALALALALAAPAAPARAGIEIVRVTSPGGIEAWVHEDHSIPILTIAAGFPGGALLDPEGREGATYLMAALLQEGAGGLDASAFAVAGEELAAHMSFWATDDAVGFGATMLADERQETVELLRLALTEPRFDAEAVERLRAQVLASIHAAAADPGSVGAHAFYADAFPGHPYGRPTNGTLESVAAIGVDDLRRAHATALTRDRLHVAVVGAIRPDEVGPLLDRLLGDLPEAGRTLPPPVEPSLSGDTSVIDFDTPQSLVVFGNAGLRSGDPDLIPALVMDYVLGGGGFGSRLTAEMREKRGLTYGVYTYHATHTLAGLYMGSFSSSNDRVAAALAILRAEWDRMATGGVTDAELASAKRFLTGDYALRFDGKGSIAGELLRVQLAGLGLDRINDRNALVEAVTAADIARVARRLLSSEALTAVVVGRPEGFAPGK